MNEIRSKTIEVTVTIPEYLYEVSLRMTELGLFRDLSELIGAGLRRELREAQHLLEVEARSWEADVKELRKEIQQRQAELGQSPLSEEEVIDQLRTIRREIWERDYKSYYTLGS